MSSRALSFASLRAPSVLQQRCIAAASCARTTMCPAAAAVAAARRAAFHGSVAASRKNPALENIKSILDKEKPEVVQKIRPQPSSSAAKGAAGAAAAAAKGAPGPIGEMPFKDITIDAEILKKYAKEGELSEDLLKKLSAGSKAEGAAGAESVLQEMSHDELERLEQVLKRMPLKEPTAPKTTINLVQALLLIMVATLMFARQRDRMELEMSRDLLAQTAEEVGNEVIRMRDQRTRTKQFVTDLLQQQSPAGASSADRAKQAAASASAAQQYFASLEDEDRLNVQRVYDGTQGQFINEILSKHAAQPVAAATAGAAQPTSAGTPQTKGGMI